MAVRGRGIHILVGAIFNRPRANVIRRCERGRGTRLPIEIPRSAARHED